MAQHDCTQKDLIQKTANAIWGNGKNGLVTDVAVNKWKMNVIIMMNTAIIGLLIKLIFFAGK